MAQKSSSSSPSINGTSTMSNIEFQKIILALLIIVTIGYFLLLILAPTNMYYNIWTPKIIAHTSNSTYFGAQVLGCLYLHLSMKSNDRNINRHDLLVMVSGGSGITPFISIIRELIHTSESQKCKTPEIRQAVLNMLIICISIVITSSAAFAWNKRQSGTDKKQIQNMEGATPMASPNSWFYNADREMESLPQQSLFQTTNLHYVDRPDLKRLLFERKESSVGVLVCGPKKMRHEVANICSSCLASNLHFESISFSW
ncbi:hypothetical protein H5410_011902 [Solanum commersonii]|uniref:Ferric reductase NAD binding domain-containing protein n=1 Tax=Solanum commersonii TaxID=4109 RepID=A0A9J6AQQ0_SOLCO|nr:hypothetical protein H5410_011902 [Solanum commersonii]